MEMIHILLHFPHMRLWAVLAFLVLGVSPAVWAEDPTVAAVAEATTVEEVRRNRSIEVLVNAHGSKYTIRKDTHAQSILEQLDEPQTPQTRWRLLDFNWSD